MSDTPKYKKGDRCKVIKNALAPTYVGHGITMEQILEILKGQPKEVLQWIVLELMKDNKLSFADIAETHVKYLEMLRKGQSEKLMHLRTKVIDLWCGSKKNLPKSLVTLITEGMNEGWVNITQEQIDKSKWSK